LFGNRWLPQTTRRIAPEAHTLFFRRRHQPRRKVLAKYFGVGIRNSIIRQHDSINPLIFS